MTQRILSLLLILPILAACAGLPTPTASVPTVAPGTGLLTVPPPEVSATPATAHAITPTLTPEPTPAPSSTPVSLPAPAYNLSAVLDYARHTLSAVEQVRYTNRSSESISKLLLVADAVVYPGAFNLTSLKATAGPQITSSTWESTWLHVELAQPLAPGDQIALEAQFDLILPARTAEEDARPMVFGWSERQTNLVDWYLYFPPYLAGQGWLAHKPYYYGEHQVYEASNFDVTLQVKRAPAGLSVAASAPQQVEGEDLHYQLDSARTFALSLSDRYQVITRLAGEIRVTGYYFAEHAAAGERAVQVAAQALELYGRLFAALSRTSLAVVEADFLDGMEYDGLFFLSNGFFNLYDGGWGNYLVALSAHETTHQWWYGLVGNDQALEPWLDEALCTYSEKLYYEQYFPDALGWWWEYRVRYYEPAGFVSDSIYNPHGSAYPYRDYRDAVYLNGAVFLDELRLLVGDEAFFSFLHDYAIQNAGQIANAQGFFSLLRSHTTADLAPLLKKYFEQAPSGN